MIKLGNLKISKINVGTSSIKKVYLGNASIYNKNFTITPTLENVYAADDNPTVIEKNETKTLYFYTKAGATAYALPDTVSVSGASASWTVYKVYNYRAVGVNITFDGALTKIGQIAEDETVTLTAVAASGYVLPTTIQVVGASYTWNSTTGEIVLSNPTAAIVIRATGANPPTVYSITASLTNATANSGNPTTVSTSGASILEFYAADGYILPASSRITVTNATYSWSRSDDYSTGWLSLSNPTGDVTVSITALPASYPSEPKPYP